MAFGYIQINDIIWGQSDLHNSVGTNRKDTVLLRLMDTPEMQRLKNIEQSGLPKEFASVNGFSRWEHSIGVMLLLRRLGADLGTQVKGLLYNVSRTAFSHTIDNVLGKVQENPKDMHKEYLCKTSLARILTDYNYNIDDIADVKSSPLLYADIPNLGADISDYAIREFYYNISPHTAMNCAKSVIKYGDQIVFDSKHMAEVFAKNYMQCQNGNWAGPESLVKAYFMSELIREGLESEELIMPDFWEDDIHVMRKLRRSFNPKINQLFAIMTTNMRPYKINETNPQLTLQKKFKWVDPLFVCDKKLYRLSKEDEDYAKLLEEHRKINEKGFQIDLLVDLQK